MVRWMDGVGVKEGVRRGRKKRTYHFLKVFDLRERVVAVRP